MSVMLADAGSTPAASTKQKRAAPTSGAALFCLASVTRELNQQTRSGRGRGPVARKARGFEHSSNRPERPHKDVRPGGHSNESVAAGTPTRAF